MDECLWWDLPLGTPVIFDGSKKAVFDIRQRALGMVQQLVSRFAGYIL